MLGLLLCLGGASGVLLVWVLPVHSEEKADKERTPKGLFGGRDESEVSRGRLRGECEGYLGRPDMVSVQVYGDSSECLQGKLDMKTGHVHGMAAIQVWRCPTSPTKTLYVHSFPSSLCKLQSAPTVMASPQNHLALARGIYYGLWKQLACKLSVTLRDEPSKCRCPGLPAEPKVQVQSVQQKGQAPPRKQQKPTHILAACFSKGHFGILHVLVGFRPLLFFCPVHPAVMMMMMMMMMKKDKEEDEEEEEEEEEEEK